MNLAEVCAELVRHFRLRLDEIEQLDRWTIANIYFAARDKNGSLRIKPKERQVGDELTPREVFWAWAKGHAWPDWYIDLRWQHHQKESAKHGR